MDEASFECMRQGNHERGSERLHISRRSNLSQRRTESTPARSEAALRENERAANIAAGELSEDRRHSLRRVMTTVDLQEPG